MTMTPQTAGYRTRNRHRVRVPQAWVLVVS
jgi:hypothetical protein